ncbi:centromere protein H [Ciconia maguari]
MELLRAEPGAVAAAAEGRSVAEADVLMLLRLRDLMKQQLTEYSTAFHAGQESYLDHTTEEKFINNATQDLERDMEEIKVSFQNKTLALQRMQFMVALRNKVKQNDNDSRLIMETMQHIVTLSKAVIEYQQQAREKEQKLIDIKRKRFSLKKAGGQKLLQIHTIMKMQKEERASMKVSEKLENLRNNLQKEREMTTVIQNVFQNIIIGSRVNWAEDPYLKAIVLQLEKNVCFM